MKITVEPVDATLGAVVTGVDIEHLDDRAWAAIHSAFLEHGVLVFPGQALSDAGQGAFARRFGDVEKLHPKQTNPTVMISNAKPDGTLSRPDEQQYRILKGNEGWHTDSTYMPLASKAAMLYALVLPPSGGETEFADMRAAWDALDPAMRAKLEHLSAYHSIYYSQSRLGYTHTTDNMYGFHDKGAPLRPMVKTHPETRRKSIYTGRHAHGIPGMDAAESERFLDDLLEFACTAPRTYLHRWTLGDLVVWDNRCVLHRARPYDQNHPRVLRGCRISGDPATELAPTFADAWAASFTPSASNASSLTP
jgi:alpha-ketoglutarate-dependent taurine dioxygenase